MSKLKKWATIWVYEDRDFTDISVFDKRDEAVANANHIIVDRVSYEHLGCDSVHFIDINDYHDEYACENFNNNIVHVFKIPDTVLNYNKLKYILVYFDDGMVEDILPFSNEKSAIEQANNIIRTFHEEAEADGLSCGDEDDYQLIEGSNSDFEAYDWELQKWCVLVKLDAINTDN